MSVRLIRLAVVLEPDQAAALLRLCNKITHSDGLRYLYPQLPLDRRNDQAYDMMHATSKVAEALCDAGASEFPWVGG